MTSIRFHYRPSTIEGSVEGKLFIRLIHKRRSALIRTGYTLRKDEWDSEKGQLKLPENDEKRCGYLRELQIKMDDIRNLLQRSISLLSERGDYEVKDIVKNYVRTPEGDLLRNFVEVLRTRLIENGQVRTARAYRSTVTSFQRFLDETECNVWDFSSKLMKSYECWILERGLKMNTLSFYMRNLRAIYNKALRENVVTEKELRPFREVFTGVYQTPHRALTEKQLNSLSSLEIKLDDGKADIQKVNYDLKLKQALNYFLFCFHARGMSFIDMAHLKKSEITGDTILYKRKKTGRFLEVKITGPMKRIMEKFDTGNSPYIFPILGDDASKRRSRYERGLSRQNRLLGILSQMAGLDVKVTTHVSRHTWASIAKRHNIELAVISEALGHSSVRTTQIYLDSFERSVMDSVSDKVSGVIKTEKKAA